MVRRLALVAALLAGCTEKPPGRKLASGIASAIAARGPVVAFLVDAARPADPAVPQDLLAGDLWVAPLDGPARKVGSGVSTQAGMFAVSQKGLQIAFLASWRYRSGEGELWVAASGGETEKVAPAARKIAWSPAAETLAFVAPDRLGIRDVATRTVPIEGLQEIAWSPDGRQIAARAAASAGGRLYLVDPVRLAVREVAPGTSDFAFAADGALAALGPPPPKGGDRPLLLDGKQVAQATAFTFSPDGKELALLSTAKQPGEATGDLFRLPRSGGAPRLVAQKVSDWRWGEKGDLLCLAAYDLRARAGTLTVSAAGGAPRQLAQRVTSFTLHGRRVLYLMQVPMKGDFRVELWGADLAAGGEPHRIDEGVYGWELVGDTLFYKARCAGGSRSCSLLRAPFAASAPPQVLARDVAGFDLSQDGTRILVQRPHRGAARAVDLAVIPAQGAPPEHLEPFVEEADPASRFADPAGKSVLYALLAAGKGGVYLLSLP